MKKKNVILMMTLLLAIPNNIRAFTFNRANDNAAKDLVSSVLSKGVTSTNEVKRGKVYTFSDGLKYFGIDKGIVLDTSGYYNMEEYTLENEYYDPDLQNIVEHSKNTLLDEYNKLDDEAKEELKNKYMEYTGAEEGEFNIEDCLIASYGDGFGGDTSSLEFEMVATGKLLNFNYVFATSEFTELPEYNDLFGLFVSVNDGPYENIALVTRNDQTKVPMNISTLRGGLSGTEMNNGLSYDLDKFTEHSLFKNENKRISNIDCATEDCSKYISECESEECEEEIDICDIDSNGCIEFNGVSNVFNAQKAVNIGDKIKVKFVIADASDKNVDSYVLIEAESLSFEPKYVANYEGSNINNFLIDIDKLNSAITFTEEEEELIKKGEEVNIHLVIQNANEIIPELDKKLINDKLGKNKVAFYFDASLYKKVGSLDEVKLSTLSNKITLSYKVEDEFINNDETKNRIYKVIRVHDGQTSIIDSNYDKETKTLTFETDRFSSYALVYEDVDINIVNNPSTYDNIISTILVTAISLISMSGLLIYKKRIN